MNTGSRPFCNARTMAKMAGGQHATLHAEWQAWGLEVYGNPFIIDTKADTFQAAWIGPAGTIDHALGDPA